MRLEVNHDPRSKHKEAEVQLRNKVCYIGLVVKKGSKASPSLLITSFSAHASEQEDKKQELISYILVFLFLLSMLDLLNRLFSSAMR